MSDSTYRTIRAFATDSFLERKSRFIGYVKPVSGEEDALAFISKIKKLNSTATHNVYAYRLREGSRKRFSDDGEPQGTAGLPVLQVIEKENLIDVCAVVTRYFGGTMLGAGGLVRAYTQGCKLALDTAQVVTMSMHQKQRIEIDYSLYNKVLPLLAGAGAIDIAPDFAQSVTVDYWLELDKTGGFTKALRELTGGKILPTDLEQAFKG